MIQDPTDQYIAAILAQYDLSGKDVLEIGCGKGRITRDLAKHARQVVATDPDAKALETARYATAAGNVTFMHALAGVPDLPAGSFDVVIYSLSLHHVPVAEMPASLAAVAAVLCPHGVIIVVEPGDGGSLTEAKERFAAGSGDERSARLAAVRAMQSLDGWEMGETVLFRTLFQFADADDFLGSMLPDYRQQPEAFIHEVMGFLYQHRGVSGIILEAGRRLNVLRRM